MKVEILKSVGGIREGQRFAFDVGQVADVDPKTGAKWIDVGIARAVEPSDAPRPTKQRREAAVLPKARPRR